MSLEVQDLLASLVAIPSHGTTTQGREDAIMNFLERYVSKTFPQVTLEQVNLSGYSNLLCLGSSHPKIILACHMDTVPPSKLDHLKLSIDGDKAYGLGTKDMKGGIVSSLVALKEIKNLEDVALIFYSDEEYTQQGIVKLSVEINKYIKSKPALVISPESRFNIGYGARGIIIVEVELIGKRAHSARPNLGVDAVKGIFSVLQDLENTYDFESDLGKTTFFIPRIEGGILSPDRTITLHSGSVPDIVRATIAVRNSDLKLNAKVLEALVSSSAQKLGLNLNVFNILADHPARLEPVKFITQLTSIAKNIINTEIELGDPKTAGYNDAALLGKVLDCPVINFGPNGDANHTADEWVSLESIEKTAKVLAAWIMTAKF